MCKKLLFTALSLLLIQVCVLSQVDSIDVESIEQLEEEYHDTWKTPFITDEMTIDSEQNRSWRMGDYKFSSKPKNSWEFGFHSGHFAIDGDIDRVLPAGFGVGIHLRKALNYTLSLRGSIFYGKTSGLEAQPYRHRNNVDANGIGGGLYEHTWDEYDPNVGGPGEWFPSYQTTYVAAHLSAILNIGNLLFHRERNKWNWYAGLGIGFDHHTAMMDLLDSNGLPYMDLRNRTNWTRERFNTNAGRAEIKEDLNNIYDGIYETEGFKKEGIFRIGDEFNIHFVFVPSMGFSRKISKRLNIGFEHKIFISDNDYLDGIKFRTSVDQTNNLDVGHYSHIVLGINLGNFDNVTEPLYWLNPLDAAFNDIAQLKSEPQLDLTDEDRDGVIDLIDIELNTKEDCPVDTRGMILDSDGDGFVDCEDSEPYSKPGCPVDDMGVSTCGNEINEEYINRLIDAKTEELRTAMMMGSSVIEREHFYRTDTVYRQDGRIESIAVNPVDRDGNVLSTSNTTLASRIDTVYMQSGEVDYVVSSPIDRYGNSLFDNSYYTKADTVFRSDGTIRYISTSPTEGYTNELIRQSQEQAAQSAQSAQGGLSGSVSLDTNAGNGATRESSSEATRSNANSILSTDNYYRTDTVLRGDGTIERISYTPVDNNGATISNSQISSKSDTIYQSDGTVDFIQNVPVDAFGNSLLDSNYYTASDKAFNSDGTISYIVLEPTPAYRSKLESASKSVSNSDAGSVSNATSNNNKSSGPYTTYVRTGCGDWFLPMIHYDLNKDIIKPEYYSHIHNVAQVMQKCPDVCVVAQGHTDSRHTNDYNTVLSYKRAKKAVDYLVDNYGIDRSRIKLMYGGEDNPMIKSPSSEAHHFMNRRVEFRTCEAGDYDMTAPEGYNPNAKPSPPAKNKYYNGNKSSGY
ncbi:MAG: OmpA family protein [Saprospiraceae bacterium]|nr:OmpA family protein [Saprospiraceae bacterium]